MKLNIGLVGATGMVGQAFMELLIKRDFPVDKLQLFASASSEGQTQNFQGKLIPLQVLKPQCFKGLDVVFFSSGDEISREWAPQAVSQGAFAIDNSAAFRMSKDHLLIVPEVNGHLLPSQNTPTLIANPNCSTIQLVVALKPLQENFGLEAVRVSTYQAVSGAGKAGKEELIQQSSNPQKKPRVFSSPIAFNCVPQIGSFNEDGFSSEEVKIMQESKKILEDPQIKISAFTVRVPVINGHSEVVWATLKDSANITTENFYQTLEAAPGITVHREGFPTAKETSGSYPVHVGRIHKDASFSNTWLMWVVADNVYKGAALNGLQIAEHIFDISPGM